MLHFTPDETRALALVCALITLASIARVASPNGDTLATDAPALDAAAQEAQSDTRARENDERNRPLAPGERLDPNTASAVQLDRLPGIGPAVADRIVAERAITTYHALADLDRVPGIGPTTLDRIAPHLRLNGRANPTAGQEPRIDLNHATAAELETLPGIGPALAARIVAHREANGPFRTIEALEQVAGIGPVLRAKLEARVRVR